MGGGGGGGLVVVVAPVGGPGGLGMLPIDMCPCEDGSKRGGRTPPSVSLDVVEFCRLNAHACIPQRG